MLIISHPSSHNSFTDYLKSNEIDFILLNNGKKLEVQNEEIERNSEVTCDLSNYEEVSLLCTKLHRNFGFDLVLSHRDFTQYLAEMVSLSLGLPSRDLESIKVLTHKYFMKKHFKKYDIKTADFECMDLSLDFDEECERIESKIPYPFVIKPCNAVYSVGVVRVNNRDEFRLAYPKTKRVALLTKSFSRPDTDKKFILIERYIHGKEFNLDGFSVNGKWQPLMLSEKFPDLHGPRFQENALVFHTQEIKKEFNEIGDKIVDSLALENSPFHIEIRQEYQTGELYVVEAAPRLSGMGETIECMVSAASSFDLYRFYIQQRAQAQNLSLNVDYSCGSLEYEVVTGNGGTIKAFDGLDSIESANGFFKCRLFKSPGDYIAPSEYNFESVAIFYFRVENLENAMSIIELIDEKFKVMYE
ncbi:acetyl-CoA carboxylase biotin carboxylase subunit family protein [Pseudoalteromonas piscicida]|uniref:ATP-grasp domain-containing protein n=1 Tax=Pseudoalteromonas piscicida TaxID=43662 RepID=UPI001CB7C554|nr:ATP-grasp domain-containing protein [Pseudoalteromonas piscicida]